MIAARAHPDGAQFQTELTMCFSVHKLSAGQLVIIIVIIIIIFIFFLFYLYHVQIEQQPDMDDGI